MNWFDRYISAGLAYWHGRTDLPEASCIFQIIKPLNLQALSSDLPPNAFVLLGFQCDEGIRRNHGREGAQAGPDAIREALAKLPIPRSDLQCFDAGNITCTDKNLEEAQTALAEACALILQHHAVPIVLGGGHELAWGHYQGITKIFARKRLGIINFDAHFDMRPIQDEKSTSGTPFLQMALAAEKSNTPFDYNCIGIQPSANIPVLFNHVDKYKVHYLFAEDLHLNDKAKIGSFVQRIINDNAILYLSLCMDVFSADIAPGVSAISPLGIAPWHIIPTIREFAQSGKVVAYDVAELSPRYDIDQRTAKLAAAFIFEIMQHHRGYYEK